MWAKNKRAGFTIVELLIVIVVIAILAAITVVAYNGVRQRASASAAQSALTQATQRVMAYAVDHAEQYPAESELSGLGINNDSSTDYQYTADNATSPRTFCMTVTVGGVSYYRNNTTQNTPAAGACPGHTAGGNPIVVEPEPEPLVCATNYVKVPGNTTFGTTDFCVMKYEAKNEGGVATSKADTTPWVSITQANATLRASQACATCHLITEAEWLTIAHNLINVPGNWTGNAVGSGTLYIGHSDLSPTTAQAAGADTAGYTNTGNTSGNQRRTLRLSTGDTIWDFAGNVFEWTSGQASTGQPGIAASGYTNREWKDLTVPGTLSPNPFPAFGTPAAANWTSAQGIGQAWTNSAETVTRGMLRGGAYNGGTAVAGIFALQMALPTSSNVSYGFRVTHQ